MAAYRRFVTYLFQYEYNQKMGNCGFAKVEVRQDRCRVEVQAKSNFSGDFPVYLFVRENGRQTGALLGNISMRNGSGEAVFLFSANNIGDTPFGIDDMRGLYITEEKGAFIASQWDDDETDWSQFSPYEPANERSDNAEPTTQKAESEMLEAPQEANPPLEEERKTDEVTSEEEVKGNLTEKQAEPDVTEEINISEEKIEETDRDMKEEADRTIGEGETEADTIKEQEQESPNDPGENDSELQSTQMAAAAPLINQCANAWESQWQHFSATHPVFRPFDEDKLVWGVKIQLRDFAFMPQQYQYLANNSFLLHGFFNYRYVMFGYEGEEDKRWILGVPGVFQNQEQILAGFFGFPEFRTKQNCVQRTGEFGYWYRYLDM